MDEYIHSFLCYNKKSNVIPLKAIKINGKESKKKLMLFLKAWIFYNKHFKVDISIRSSLVMKNQ